MRTIFTLKKEKKVYWYRQVNRNALQSPTKNALFTVCPATHFFMKHKLSVYLSKTEMSMVLILYFCELNFLGHGDNFLVRCSGVSSQYRTETPITHARKICNTEKCLNAVIRRVIG